MAEILSWKEAKDIIEEVVHSHMALVQVEMRGCDTSRQEEAEKIEKAWSRILVG
ncbi:MAG: hypothetical protein VW577_03995 [Pelagibacteraceae bacterium]